MKMQTPYLQLIIFLLLLPHQQMYLQLVDLVSGATVGEHTQVGAVVLGHQRLLDDEPCPGVELDARWQVVLHTGSSIQLSLGIGGHKTLC